MDYLFGEGIRGPLRIRAGWGSDDQIKALETFVATHEPAMATGQVLELPSCVLRSTGGGRPMATHTTQLPETIDQDQLTRAQKALLALSADGRSWPLGVDRLAGRVIPVRVEHVR